MIKVLQIIWKNLAWILTAAQWLYNIINQNNMEKGALTKAEERWLARFLDAVIKLPGLWELFDGAGLRTLIAIADNYVVERYMSQGFKNFLAEAIQLGKANDKEGLANLIIEKGKIDNEKIKEMGSIAIDFILSGMYEFIDKVNLNDKDVD